MKTFKEFNKNIKDFLKPKSEKEIMIILDGLDIIQKIHLILKNRLDLLFKYLLPKNKLINDLINSSYITNDYYKIVRFRAALISIQKLEIINTDDINEILFKLPDEKRYVLFKELRQYHHFNKNILQKLLDEADNNKYRELLIGDISRLK